VDCFVLIVDWGKTKIELVQHALRTAPNVSENLISVVLNKTNVKSMVRYHAYTSDYYNDEHYIHYGLKDPT
jgi:Mrp family chromosome partitioning ATPase